ncbi:MAG: hypothetical protein ACRDT6_02575 [Micromonosporaceae bacterium]
MTIRIRPGLVYAVLAVLGFALLIWLAPYYSTQLWWMLRKTLFLAVPIGAAGIPALLIWWYDEDLLVDFGGLILGAGVLAVIGLVGWGVYHSYLQDKDYAASVEVESGGPPAFGERAPFQVAEAMARPNLGDVPGDITDTSYLPDTDRFSNLVARRGWLAGYQTVLTQNIPMQGRGQPDQRCEFTLKADARVGGWFTHNLGRQINKQARWRSWDNDDVYAYCDRGAPKVVVPLKRQVGWLVVTDRPAGVAIYDGRTGEITITDRTTVPGPAYPLSLASEQREATSAIGSFGDWFFNRAGWELPDDEVNSGNDSEFTLDTDRGSVYATPLTGRGSATSISVISVVSAKPRSGELAPLSVHRLKPSWVSPKAIVDKIKADYQDIPNWQNIKVYEVVPTGPDSWVATLGAGQNILYRVSGTGTLKGEKPTCLHRADGSVIRCGTLADRDGRGVGTDYGSGGKGSGDLSELTDEELADLQRRVTEEFERRLEERD